MLYRDTHVSRQLAAERHAELTQEGRTPEAGWAPAESRHDRFHVVWLRAPLRSNARVPARHAS